MKIKSTFIGIFVLCFPLLAFLGNDTDGVISKGLFPITSDAHLKLESAEIHVIFKSTTLRVIREYEIKNEGESGNFQFGTVICSNCYKDSLTPKLQVYVNDQLATFNLMAGYLRDEGGYVNASEDPYCTKCTKYTDGIICCHSWAQFETSIKKNKIATIRLDYKIDLIPLRNMIHQILSELRLYTEKFWDNMTIPKITYFLEGDDSFVPITHFIPEGNFKKHSIIPDVKKANMLTWIFTNYTPKKEQYTYGKSILHPYAIDKEAICRDFTKNSEAIYCK